METGVTATLYDLLTARLAEDGEREILICRERRVTVRGLDEAARLLGAQLRARGVATGDRVVLVAPNVPEFVVGYFGILAVGAVVVPLNPLLKTEELRYILTDSQAVALLGLESLRPALLAAREGIGRSLPLILLDAAADGPEPEVYCRETARPDSLPPAVPAGLDAVAACLYTSGTTGRSKGAQLTHGNILANIEAFGRVLQVTARDVFLTVLPLFHAYGATVMLLEPLATGARIVLEPRFQPEQILRAIAEHGVSVFSGVPSMFALLAATPRPPGDYSAWRIAISGGAPLPAVVLEAFERRHGIPIFEGYGPTECAPVLTVNPPTGRRKIGSVGPPLPGVELRVVDEADRPLPAGQVGEIVARGPNVMRGYLNQPEETARALRGGWYHTGDLGWRDEDEYYHIVDRKTDLIIVGGLNVYPSEVETTLIQHPGVREVAVVGMPDPVRGEVPRAVVVPREGVLLSPQEIIQWCRRRLANYKVPRRVELASELPRSATGKVLKAILRQG